MRTVSFRFYAEFNDFLPRQQRYARFERLVDPTTSVKHAIEALGVPHPEVDLILVNGSPVDFAYILIDGDQVSVYPVFESLDISSISPLRQSPLRDPRFVLDGHLGRLAAYLRMLGFDTLYRNDYDDEELAEISSRESRILLTRDRGLLKRKVITRGYCVREDEPHKQVAEVLSRFDLAGGVHPFSRCLRCNSPLRLTSKEDVLDRLQPDTRLYYQEFYICEQCGQIYWKGSHYQHMKKLLDSLLET